MDDKLTLSTENAKELFANSNTGICPLEKLFSYPTSDMKCNGFLMDFATPCHSNVPFFN